MSITRSSPIVFVLAVLLAIAWAGGAQANVVVRYSYDDSGRLVKAADSTGTVIQYIYDDSGNLIEIKRTSGAKIAILDFAPKAGGPGDKVTFSGIGFGMGAVTVSFNGAMTAASSSDGSTVVATVPPNATTGPVTITSPAGAATSTDPFTVGRVTINPTRAIVLPGETVQISAAVVPAGMMSQNVAWSVNGIPGGDATVGTVSTSGLYTAPATPFSATVRATSAASPALFGEVTVRSYLSGTAVDVSAANGVAAVAEGNGGLVLFDIASDPQQPRGMEQVDIPNGASRVAMGGGFVAVAGGDTGLTIVDTSDPTAAQVAQNVALPGSVTAVAAGVAAFAGTDAGEVLSVDPPTGLILSRELAGGPVQDLFLTGDYLYALTTTRLAIYSVHDSELEFITSIASPAPNGVNERLFVGGTTAYAVHDHGVNTFDVSDPGHPKLITASDDAQGGWRQVALNGSGGGVSITGASTADNVPHTVSVYNATDPSKPDQLGANFPMPAQAQAVAIYNGLAYVAAGDDGLQVLAYAPADTKGVAPTVKITTGFDPTAAPELTAVRATAVAGDDVQVGRVEWMIDGRTVFSDGGYPFDYYFITPAISRKPSFKLQARAVDTAGNATLSDVLTVTLAAVPLQVEAVSPRAYSVLHTADTVAVTFNKPVAAASITPATIRLFAENLGGAETLVSGGTLAYVDAIKTATILFPGGLLPGAYRALVSGTVADAAGGQLGTDTSWCFVVLGADLTDLMGPNEVTPLLASGAAIVVQNQTDPDLAAGAVFGPVLGVANLIDPQITLGATSGSSLGVFNLIDPTLQTGVVMGPSTTVFNSIEPDALLGIVEGLALGVLNQAP